MLEPMSRRHVLLGASWPCKGRIIRFSAMPHCSRASVGPAIKGATRQSQSKYGLAKDAQFRILQEDSFTTGIHREDDRKHQPVSDKASLLRAVLDRGTAPGLL
jgi:hypothetical protein